MTEQQPTNDSTASARERDYTPPRLTGYGRLEVDTTGVALSLIHI